MTFAWTVRLKYGALAGLAGWLAGWLMTIPFVFRLAWRYVDAHASQMPVAVAKGMVVWGAFSLFMAMAGFLPLGLPLLLFISPRWIVRWRRFLIPGATLAALLAIYHRMGLLNAYHFLHPREYSLLLHHRAQSVHHHLRPGDDVGVYRAGETTALRLGLLPE